MRPLSRLRTPSEEHPGVPRVKTTRTPRAKGISAATAEAASGCWVGDPSAVARGRVGLTVGGIGVRVGGIRVGVGVRVLPGRGGVGDGVCVGAAAIKSGNEIGFWFSRGGTMKRTATTK